MNDSDLKVREIATRVQEALMACGKCHVMRKNASSGLIHVVGFRTLVRDLRGPYALLVVDTDRLPRGVDADALRQESLLRNIERILGHRLSVLNGQGVVYVVQLEGEPLRLESTELQAA